MKTFLCSLALAVAASALLGGCGDVNHPPTPPSSGSPSAASPQGTGTQDPNANRGKFSQPPQTKTNAEASAPAGYVSEAPKEFWYIHLDTSGSMEGGRITQAKEAIRQFLLDPASEGKIFALAVFRGNGDETIEMVPFGENSRKAIIEVLPTVHTGGGTPLGEAVQFCSRKIQEQMERQYGHGMYNLLVVTDGEASDGRKLDTALEELKQVTVGKKQASIWLSTIGFQMGGAHSLARAGRYFEAKDTVSLVAKMKEATKSEVSDIDTFFGVAK